ncbi:MAG: polymerase beta domain protein region protein [Candidatus Beckwithbacteria bacterium GW2011_GWA2_43_10]|uniref:Polymerase beta domain protein region protein n=1 Tax=Candidatus Beckwithbacteria bacterium GW2011_GWA2_43_10 TaxID=1618369 RepID=A0A0G1BZ37_9BACT|nr:MAG: polymerase beta domain protein region protein [Candidatus Beckwithbacteria bacterium GW2011_GWA2_43_10]
MLNQATLTTIKKILWQHLDKSRDKAFIFGSWAIGDNRKFSDIDIGIETKRKLPTRTIANLKDTFEVSDLPYLVDVVDFNHTDKKFKELAKSKIIKLN